MKYRDFFFPAHKNFFILIPTKLLITRPLKRPLMSAPVSFILIGAEAVNARKRSPKRQRQPFDVFRLIKRKKKGPVWYVELIQIPLSYLQKHIDMYTTNYVEGEHYHLK